MKTAFVGVALFAATLAGCQTAPPRAGEATPIPAERVVLKTLPSQSAATVVVTRDTGLVGSGCYMAFTINDDLAGRFDTGETTTYYLPAGRTRMRAEVDPQGRGLCGVGQSGHWTQHAFSLQPNETFDIRIGFEADGTLIVQRTN